MGQLKPGDKKIEILRNRRSAARGKDKRKAYKSADNRFVIVMSRYEQMHNRGVLTGHHGVEMHRIA